MSRSLSRLGALIAAITVSVSLPALAADGGELPPTTVTTVKRQPMDLSGLGKEWGLKSGAAHEFAQQKKLKEAEALADEILAGFKKLMNDPNARYVCFRSARDYKRFMIEMVKKGASEAEVAAVVRVSWAFCRMLNLKAFIAVERKRWQAALKLLMDEARHSPCSANPYCEMGFILNKLKMYKLALKTYTIAAKLAETYEGSKPDHPMALRGMGYAQIELGQLDAAKASYLKSLQLDPGNKIALHELKFIEKLQAKKKQTTPQK